MSARKLIYRFMVCAPALFLAGLGVNARTLLSDFEPVANDPHTEAETLAYVPLLREFRNAQANHEEPIVTARRVATKWVDGAQRGELKALRPVAYEDSSTEGAKSEIFQVKSSIVGTLNDEAFFEMKSGHLASAVSDLALAIRVAESVKTSDFLSLFNSASEERRSFSILAKALPKLDLAHRKLAATLCSEVHVSTREMQDLAELSRRLFVDYRERRHDPPLGIEDTQLLADMPELVTKSAEISGSEFRTRLVACADDEIPTLASCMRMGVNAQDLLEQQASQIRASLTSAQSPEFHSGAK